MLKNLNFYYQRRLELFEDQCSDVSVNKFKGLRIEEMEYTLHTEMFTRAKQFEPHVTKGDNCDNTQAKAKTHGGDTRQRQKARTARTVVEKHRPASC